MNLFEAVLLESMFVLFVFSLMKKWKLNELWDTYLPFKRCMFCLSWWISLAITIILCRSIGITEVLISAASTSIVKMLYNEDN